MSNEKSVYKKYGLFIFKYFPLFLAMSCLCKIWLFYLHIPIVVKLVNILLNTLIALDMYCLGRALGYCKFHHFFCNFALFGYFWYAIFLIFGIPYNNIYATSFLISYTIVFIYKCIKYLKWNLSKKCLCQNPE